MTITCCKDCEERHPKCHSDCERYLAQRELLDKETEAERVFQTNEAVGFIADNQRKKKNRWIKGMKGGHK